MLLLLLVMGCKESQEEFNFSWYYIWYDRSESKSISDFIEKNPDIDIEIKILERNRCVFDSSEGWCFEPAFYVEWPYFLCAEKDQINFYQG